MEPSISEPIMAPSPFKHVQTLYKTPLKAFFISCRRAVIGFRILFGSLAGLEFFLLLAKTFGSESRGD